MIKKSLLFLAAIALLIPTALAAYSDVSEDHPNYDAITYLSEHNVIQGYEDETFKPDELVNRAEFLKILIEGSEIDPDPTVYNNCFPDVSADWYAKYVCYALEQEWVQGYADGNFKPSNNINYVEAVKVLIEAHGYADEVMPITNPDINPAEYWYVPYVALAQDKGFVEHKATEEFTEYQTRAQIAEMTYRSMIVQEQGLTTYFQILSRENEISLGDENAPVTFTVYDNYSCPHCATLYENVFPQLKEEYIDTGLVRYIQKDLTFYYPSNSYYAALAARCANDQGAFWEMRDAIFENVAMWISAEDVIEIFNGFAKDLGLLVGKFNTCMVEEHHEDVITADQGEAISIGVQATPTVFVNDEKITGSLPFENFKTVIDYQLSLSEEEL